MNLRAFHALLIALSAVLAAVFGGWCLRLYWRESGAAALVAAVLAIAASLGLILYDRWFLRKTRTLR
jgi:hypothetical protein